MSLNPIISAARAYPAAFPGSSCGTQRASVTRATVMPGSTMMYAIEMHPIPNALTYGATFEW